MNSKVVDLFYLCNGLQKNALKFQAKPFQTYWTNKAPHNLTFLNMEKQ
jgi:hypothetical protein